MNDIASHLVIISAPSGTGKDTIVSELIKMDDSISMSCSATTRARRDTEVDGINYYFLSPEEFEERVVRGDFIEYARYGSACYGTLKEDVQRRIERGKTVVLVIEVHGAFNVKRKYPEALAIFVVPPSMAELRRRLTRRGSETSAQVEERLRIAEQEMLLASQYDKIVVNDDLEKAVREIYALIRAHCPTNQ